MNPVITNILYSCKSQSVPSKRSSHDYCWHDQDSLKQASGVVFHSKFTLLKERGQ